jgi:hypothetical protein
MQLKERSIGQGYVYNLEHPREDAVAREAVEENDGEPAAVSLRFLLPPLRRRLGAGWQRVLGHPEVHYRAGIVDVDGAWLQPCLLRQAVHQLLLGYLHPVHHPHQLVTSHRLRALESLSDPMLRERTCSSMPILIYAPPDAHTHLCTDLIPIKAILGCAVRSRHLAVYTHFI